MASCEYLIGLGMKEGGFIDMRSCSISWTDGDNIIGIDDSTNCIRVSGYCKSGRSD